MDPPTVSPQQRKAWKEAGRCGKCGRQTHQKFLFGYVKQRMTVEGHVFDGICLRCNTLTSAKLWRNKPIDGRDLIDEQYSQRTRDITAPPSPADNSGVTREGSGSTEASAEGMPAHMIWGLHEVGISEISMDYSTIASTSGPANTLVNDNEANLEQEEYAEIQEEDYHSLQGSLGHASCNEILDRAHDDGQVPGDTNNINTTPRAHRSNNGQITIYDRKIAGKYGAYGDAGQHAQTASDESESHGQVGPNNDNTSSGVHRSDSGGRTIYDRKLAGKYDAHEDASRNGEDCHAPTAIGGSHGQVGSFPGVERRRGFDRLDALIREKNATRSLISNCASCCEVLHVLEHKPYSADIVIEALEKFRDLLPIAQAMADPRCLNNKWPKVFASFMSSRYLSNAVVQAGILRTLWSIFSLNHQYISDLTLIAEMKDIIHVMETHFKDESVQEYGCGLIACISSSQKQALGLLQVCDGRFIQLLMNALQSPSVQGSVQKNALKAMFRLSSASLSSGTPSKFFDMVCSAQGDIHRGNSLTDAMHIIIKSMQSYRNNTPIQVDGIRLLLNILESDSFSCGDRCNLVLGKILQHASCHQKSQVFHEAVICILSKTSWYGPNLFEGKIFPLFITETMLAHPKSCIVALHGCRCITNIYDQSPTPDICQEAIASSNGVAAIISCMKTFREHIIVQSEACTALSAICDYSTENKEAVWRAGGIDRIICAYDSYSWDAEMSTATKIRAAIALNSLFLDCREILADVRDKGLIQRFKEESSSVLVPIKLRHTIQELLACETCESLRGSMIELATSCFVETNSINSMLSGAAKAMESFPKCAKTQEIACKLVACVLASEKAECAGDMDVADLETMVVSLKEHKERPANVVAACSALRNLCVFQMTYPCDDKNYPCVPMESFAGEVVSSMALHENNESILEQATGALWAFCAKDNLALYFSADDAIGVIARAMNRFPTSSLLQRNGIEVFWAFFSISEKGADYLTDELVTAIVRFIGESDEVDAAIDIVLILASTGIRALEILLRNEVLIYSIVGCMYSYPNSTSIQGASIDILSKMALSNYLKNDICQSGGTSRVLSALETLQHDHLVVCKAYAALANLVGGVDFEILRAHNAPAVMVYAMQAHPHSLPIQTGAAYALWALSKQFADEIVSLGGAEAVAEAMARFVGSKQMQEKGFGFLRSLSISNSLKSRVGRCAIEPLVNGLSAHISAQKICIDGLGCIKSLSMHPSNKRLLEENGAFELICSCMWRHSGNSLVCEAALAALCKFSATVNADSDLGYEILQITNEDLAPICFVMRSHEHVKRVQELALILLEIFTLSLPNTVVIGMHPYIADSIRGARSTFHESFGGRVDYLLQILEPHIQKQQP